MDHITNIWSEVSNWPPEQRLALAARLLQSLEREDAPAAFTQRQEALRQLIGIWKTVRPPNDAQVEQMIEQERIKKYG
jgi:hypothetical protein